MARLDALKESVRNVVEKGAQVVQRLREHAAKLLEFKDQPEEVAGIAAQLDAEASEFDTVLAETGLPVPTPEPDPVPDPEPEPEPTPEPDPVPEPEPVPEESPPPDFLSSNR